MTTDAKQLGQCLPADLLLRMEKELMGQPCSAGGVNRRAGPIHAGEEETARNVIDMMEWKRRHAARSSQKMPHSTSIDFRGRP